MGRLSIPFAGGSSARGEEWWLGILGYNIAACWHSLRGPKDALLPPPPVFLYIDDMSIK